MDDVARAACVGTGTLYRRFGDRAGLALALLDEHTRDVPGRADRRAAAARPGRAGRRAPARVRRRATSTCSSATPTCWSPRRRRRARAAGARAALRDAPRDPAARGGAAPRRRVHRAGAARDAAPGAPPLRAPRARLAARAPARRVARAGRRADRLSASGAAPRGQRRRGSPSPSAPRRRCRPCGGRGRRGTIASPPGPSRCSTLPIVRRSVPLITRRSVSSSGRMRTAPAPPPAATVSKKSVAPRPTPAGAGVGIGSGR